MLWILVLLALLAAGLTSRTRTALVLARNATANAEAEALAEAGVYSAIGALRNGAWPETQLAREQGRIRLTVRDESGKLDLNTGQPGLLLLLLRSFGLDAEASRRLQDAILDYRDPDATRRAYGAEDADYREAGLGYGAKDGPFERVEELAFVLGMTPELLARLAPAVTVHSGEPAPPLGRAVPEVMSALALIAAGGRPAATPALAAATGRGAGPRPERPGTGTYAIRAAAETRAGAVFVREAVVRVDDASGRPFTIHAWRRGG